VIGSLTWRFGSIRVITARSRNAGSLRRHPLTLNPSARYSSTHPHPPTLMSSLFQGYSAVCRWGGTLVRFFFFISGANEIYDIPSRGPARTIFSSLSQPSRIFRGPPETPRPTLLPVARSSFLSFHLPTTPPSLHTACRKCCRSTCTLQRVPPQFV